MTVNLFNEPVYVFMCTQTNTNLCIKQYIYVLVIFFPKRLAVLFSDKIRIKHAYRLDNNRMIYKISHHSILKKKNMYIYINFCEGSIKMSSCQIIECLFLTSYKF